MDIRYAIDFGKKLLQVHSPTGYTEKAVEFLATELKSLGVPYTITRKGAIYCTIEGKNTQEHRMITAHVDTLGAMVREIKSNGNLRLMNIGGFPFNHIEGENLFVITREGKLISGTGLPNTASVHAFDDVGSKKRGLDEFEMRVDIVTNSKEETKKAGINVGDFVVFDPRTVETETGFIKSRFLDDKICVAIAFAVIKELITNKIKPACTTHFFISNYEEVGHGLSVMDEKTDRSIAELLAIDIGTVAQGQASREDSVTIMAKDGATPYDYRLRKRLEDIAIAKNIKYETDVMYHYGSDASAFVKTGADLQFLCVGPGVHRSEERR